MKKTKIFKTIVSIITSSIIASTLVITPINAETNLTDHNSDFVVENNIFTQQDMSPQSASEGYYITSTHFDYHDRMFLDEGESAYINLHSMSGAPIGDDIHIVEWAIGGGATVERINSSRYKITAGRQGLYRVDAIIIQDNVKEDVGSISFYMAVPYDVQLSITSMSFKKGITFPLGLYSSPAYMVEQSTWASSNESVATVDQQGNVVAINPGIAIISLTTPHPGLLPVYMPQGYAECTITVYE